MAGGDKRRNKGIFVVEMIEFVKENEKIEIFELFACYFVKFSVRYNS